MEISLKSSAIWAEDRLASSFDVLKQQYFLYFRHAHVKQVRVTKTTATIDNVIGSSITSSTISIRNSAGVDEPPPSLIEVGVVVLVSLVGVVVGLVVGTLVGASVNGASVDGAGVSGAWRQWREKKKTRITNVNNHWSKTWWWIMHLTHKDLRGVPRWELT